MQIKTGVVTVENQSPVVVGQGTQWLEQVLPGALFKVRGVPGIYEVGAVQTDTQLQLTAPFVGPTAQSVEYLIAIDFTSNIGLPEICTGDIEVPDIITRAFRLLDEAVVQGGSGSVTDHEQAFDHALLQEVAGLLAHASALAPHAGHETPAGAQAKASAAVQAHESVYDHSAFALLQHLHDERYPLRTEMASGIGEVTMNGGYF